MSIFYWAPTFLCEAKGNSLLAAGFQTATFNLAGILGSMTAGFLSDRFFQGYRGRSGFLFMCAVSVTLFALWGAPVGMGHLHTLIMLCIGFFIVGPQTVVGVASIDFSSKKAAGSALGLVGICGYMGFSLAGWGSAYVAERSFGWDGVFILMIVASILGCFCFLFTWNVRSKAFDTMAQKKILKLGW
jgi:sugar phosphate permease